MSMTRKERLVVGLRMMSTLAVAVAVGLVAMTLARAATSKASLVAIDHFGSALAASASKMPSGSRLELNGRWVQFNVGASDSTVPAEVERLAEQCPGDNVLRESNDDSGFVLCHEGIGDMTEVLTLDPSEIGMRSFAYVDKAEGKTRHIQLKADTQLNLGQLVPDSGDAPGFDIEAVPRIAGVERWMSFRDAGGAYQAAFYGGGPTSPEATLEWYRGQLGPSGWTVETLDSEEGMPYLLATRGGSLVLVLVEDDCDGTCLSIISAAGAP